MARVLDGLYATDYSHDRAKREQLDAHLDELDAKLYARAARIKLIEAEAKTMGRQQ